MSQDSFYKLLILGIVQGVGFRPYIYRKAKEFGLKGYVKNIGNGVEIVVNDKNFISKLDDLPPLARITDHVISLQDISDVNIQQRYDDFYILKSEHSDGETQIPPDIFMCADCLRELKDIANRRHNYYFITCTNCGPRFSMIENYPYDRPLTSMKKFQMCGECELEYANPLNRRYHAQTIACKKCGPRLRLLKKSEDISEAVDADTIKKAADILKQGEVVSIKGVGGFHVCSSSDASAVNKVRHLLNRPNKPFALMVKDIEMLKKIAVFSDKEKEILCSPQRPIVVLEKKRKEMLSHVSELDSIGVMLPYTALHYLLFDHIDEPLVMTSCNIPGEPVSTTENMADFFLTHERDIVNRCDDSVIKVISDTLFFLRRSRGYSPLPVRLPLQAIDTLSLGAEFNNALCAAKNENAFLSQYIGDTSKFETCRFMKESAEKMILLTRLKPKVIACDLHPGYNSTHLAKELSIRHGATLMQFQHHKAHVAGAAAEHGLTDYVGIAMDGLGYGEDGKMWGGEVFNVDNGTTFSRIGHLEEHPQLGGDSAALYPKKMLFGILYGFLGEKELLDMNLFEKKESALYLNQLNSNFNTIPTTSSGRILDAVAALLGICDKRTYDGRPAILLESIATQPLKLEPVFIRKESKRILSTNELFRFLVENKNNDKSVLAATAQMYLAQGLYEIAKELSEKTGKEIVLSGGVAYNRMISEFMVKRKVLVNKEIPAGDGGICYGQAYLANLHFLKDSNNTSRIAGN